jgi:hypothetical protein
MERKVLDLSAPQERREAAANGPRIPAQSLAHAPCDDFKDYLRNKLLARKHPAALNNAIQNPSPSPRDL